MILLIETFDRHPQRFLGKVTTSLVNARASSSLTPRSSACHLRPPSPRFRYNNGVYAIHVMRPEAREYYTLGEKSSDEFCDWTMSTW